MLIQLHKRSSTLQLAPKVDHSRPTFILEVLSRVEASKHEKRGGETVSSQLWSSSEELFAAASELFFYFPSLPGAKKGKK